MKVALVIENLDVSRGGRETSTAQIASSLAAADCDVTVLCQRGSCMDGQVQVRPLGPNAGPRWWQQAQFVRRVRAAIAAERFDIVHAMLPVPGANVYQPRSGTLQGQRQSSIRRREGLGRVAARAGWLLTASRLLAAQSERRMLSDGRVECLCVSEMVRREFHELYDRENSVRTVFNAVELPRSYADVAPKCREEFRRHLRVGPDELVFLCVAKNFLLKGVGETIEAFARFLQRHSAGGHRLVLIGERNSHDAYHRQVADLRLGERVVFIPHEDNIFVRYPAADVCVLLSWYDPCSRVILEAVRCGIPSITTRLNGASEALAGGAGLVVDSPRDVDRAAEAMATLADPLRRRQCAEACGTMSEHLGMERQTRELLGAYKEVASRS